MQNFATIWALMAVLVMMAILPGCTQTFSGLDSYADANANVAQRGDAYMYAPYRFRPYAN